MMSYVAPDPKVGPTARVRPFSTLDLKVGPTVAGPTLSLPFLRDRRHS